MPKETWIAAIILTNIVVIGLVTLTRASTIALSPPPKFPSATL
jgi:hypothetical protein